MHPALARRVVYPLLQWKGQGQVLPLLAELERSQWHGREELAELQWVKLAALLHHAYRHVPYYRALFQARDLHPRDLVGLEDYARLPALRKETVRDRRRELTAEGARGPIVERRTSGSTGIPLAVAVSPRARDAWTAAALRARRWWGVQLGARQLSLIHPHGKARGTLTRQALLMNHTEQSVFHLEERTLARLDRQLRRGRYDVLVGYPSALGRVAQLLAERGVVGGVRLRAVLTTAEVLHPDQRALLERVFGCPVINSYGTAESDHMAVECPEGRMHIAAENVLIEISQRGADNGERPPGELLITDLNNHVMPLLRYRIGDLGELGPACPCGRSLPVLRLREGRTEDLLILPDGRTMDGAIFDAAVEDLIRLGVGVRQFRAVQHAPDHIEVLVATPDRDHQALPGLADRLQAMLGTRLRVVVRPVDLIPVDPTGKLRRFISLLSERGAPEVRG